MITPASLLITRAAWSQTKGKFAVFKAKNQVALYWAEPAVIISHTDKTIVCAHPDDSLAYAIGSGRAFNHRPVTHRKASVVAVCDTEEEVKQLSELNARVVQNQVLLQALAHACPHKQKELEKFITEQENELYKKIETINNGT